MLFTGGENENYPYFLKISESWSASFISCLFKKRMTKNMAIIPKPKKKIDKMPGTSNCLCSALPHSMLGSASSKFEFGLQSRNIRADLTRGMCKIRRARMHILIIEGFPQLQQNPNITVRADPWIKAYCISIPHYE